MIPMLLALLACRCSQPPQQTVLPDPLTVDDALALAATPGIEVEVNKVDPMEKGCPHIVCLPIVLVAELVPDHRRVTVRQNGEPTWEALYTPKGRLVGGMARRETGWERIEALEARKIDKSWVVVTGTAPDVDGRPGEFTDIPRDPQLVIDHYLPELDKADSRRQVALTREAAQLFGPSAQPAFDWVVANSDDQALEALLTKPIGLTPYDETLRPIAREFAKQPHGVRASAALLCHGHEGHPMGNAPAVVIEATCRLDDGWQDAFKYWNRCAPYPRDPGLIAPCNPGPGRAIASLWLDMQPDRADLTQARIPGTDTAKWLERHR